MNAIKGAGPAVRNIRTAADEDRLEVVLVGSRLQFSDCLARLIATEIEGAEVKRAATPLDLADAATPAPHQCRLILLDEVFAEGLDLSLLDRLRRSGRDCLAIGYRDGAAMVRRLRSDPALMRAISLVPMDLNPDSWLSILRLILSGCHYVPTELFAPASAAPDPVPAAVPAAKVSAPLAALTAREMEVLQLVAEGLQNKHIANRLKLSENTVKLHLHHVATKLGARNRTEAALRYRAELG